MTFGTHLGIAAATLLALGCGSGSSPSAGPNSTHGSASYVKPAADGGQPVQPQPKSDDMQVTIALAGQADFTPVTGTACALTSGDFSESTQSSGQVGSDGTYVSSFSTQSSSGSLSSPLCGAVKNVKTKSVTTLTLQSSVPANSTNCSGYCTATANSQCSSADQTCITNAKATCTTQCQASTRITGHGSLSQSDMATTNSGLGSGSGDVEAKVDLIFDALQ